MQKRKKLQIFISILITIYFGCYKYCDAQIEQRKVYVEFEQLVHSKQKAKVIEAGRVLFESLVSKYPENTSFQVLQRRLEVAEELTEIITKSLESKQKKALSDITDLDILPAFPSVSVNEENSNYSLPPAEQLYLVNLPSFSDELTFQEILPWESKFLQQYYDLRMQNCIETVINTTTQVKITSPGSSGLSYYGFVLPLLYRPEEAPGWNTPEFFLDMLNSDSLDAMSDFCLLRVGRPKTAAAIAKYKAKSEGRKFSPVDWSLIASSKCVKNHRPDIAERLLQTAIENVSDVDNIVQLRLKIAKNYSTCGDNANAAEKSKQIAADFPESPLYGKVISSYFAYLARQSKAQEILTEIDRVLEKPQSQKYLPQLMYLKWWALRKTNQRIPANKVGEQLIEDYGNNPFVAPVLLAQATDALSNQHYDQCRKLLVQLTQNFPQTSSANQARKILRRLGQE